MAWGGKHSRMTSKQRAHFLRTSNRALPQPDPPYGIPKRILKTLASEGPLPKDVLNARLQALLAEMK